MQPGAPTLSGKDTVRGTQEELFEAMKHYLAYCGRYDLAEANGEVLVKCNCKLPLSQLARERDAHYIHGSLVWERSQSTVYSSYRR